MFTCDSELVTFFISLELIDFKAQKGKLFGLENQWQVDNFKMFFFFIFPALQLCQPPFVVLRSITKLMPASVVLCYLLVQQ